MRARSEAMAEQHMAERMARRPILPSAHLVGAHLAGTLLAGVLLAGTLAVLPARAQSFLGTGPAERLTVPPSGDALRPLPPPERPPAGGPPAREARPPAGDEAGRGGAVPATLEAARRFPAGTQGFRLAGEEDVLQYPIYLTEAQTRGQTRLRVSYLSAISVAPEASSLTASVNGTKVGWTRIQAPGAVKVVEFALPDGLLRPGYNAVSLTASQRHRVDCSLGATYELWTQIDPSRSGLVVPAASDLDLKTLAALEPDESGALPIGIALAERPGPERLERIVGAVQAVALVGRLARPAVTFGPPLTGRPGVTLVVGTARELQGTEGLEEIGPITGPKLALLAPRAGRAPTLVVTGPTGPDVRQAIEQLARSGDAGGTPAGTRVATLTRGYQVRGDETLSLDTLGLVSHEFSGRLMRVAFEVRFPADFVPADYGKVMLHLAGGYAAGLEPTAQIIVDINGRNAASLPLPSARGEILHDNAIPLPLSLWRPGLNRVEIAAQLPVTADATCDTLASEAKRSRFLFLDRTRLVVPPLARAVRSPDLAVVKAGAVPFVAPGRRPRLVLPTPDRDSVEAAATIAARLAIAARQVIDFEVGSDEREGSASLIVAPARALNPRTLDAAGLDPDQIRQVWEGRAEAVATPGQFGAAGVLTLDRLRRNVPMRCALPPATVPLRVAAPAAPRPPPPPRAAPPPSERDLLARWGASMQTPNPVLASAAAAWETTTRTAGEVWAALLGRLRPPVDAAPVEVSPRASLIIAEAPGAQDFADAAVIVTAPNPSMLKASVSCLVDPVVWTQLLGRAALLDASDGTLTVVPPGRTRVLATQGWSLANIRLVSAAWLSLNPAIYVGLTLVMALCLGLTTTSLVRQLGRKSR
ncbi:cellulose biosynthesis cyclic di-GMP-binding regulatory protein BcsB [Methylobacterium oryzisoli]|uniref:cellulose biosynthesis cyclic di-GMP-binding regulatory protein BcsB n=1 Tax=Methylobacterium oryzisoli TaxID=3385502 RepID=UPI0038920B30